MDIDLSGICPNCNKTMDRGAPAFLRCGCSLAYKLEQRAQRNEPSIDEMVSGRSQAEETYLDIGMDAKGTKSGQRRTNHMGMKKMGPGYRLAQKQKQKWLGQQKAKRNEQNPPEQK